MLFQLIYSQNYNWAVSVGGSGNEHISSSVKDANGNLYVTGYFIDTVDFDPGTGYDSLYSTTAAYIDAYVARYDGSGTLVWVKSFGGTLTDAGDDITLDNSGNVYVTGSFTGTVDFNPGPGVLNLTSAGTEDIFVSKFDINGNFIWAFAIGGSTYENASAIACDNSGDIYLGGSFQISMDVDPGAGIVSLSSAGNTDGFYAKYTSSGNLVWANSFGAVNGDGVSDMKADNNGNIYMTGNFSNTVDFNPGTGVANLSSAGGRDMFFAKYDNLGNYLWAKRIGGSNGENSHRIKQDYNGNILILGYFQGTIDADPGTGTLLLTPNGTQDVFIGKYDNNGSLIWANGIGGNISADGSDLSIDSIGNIFITGYFEGSGDFNPGSGITYLFSNGNLDVFVVVLTNGGGFISAMNVGGTDMDRPASILSDNAGNFLLTGYFYGTVDFDPGTNDASLSSMGGQDFFIAKYCMNPFVMQQSSSTGVNTCQNYDTILTVGVLFADNYQWQIWTGSIYVDLTNTINYNGVDNDTLHIFNIPLSFNGNRYRCLLNNACGQSFCDSILFYVDPSPTVNLGPDTAFCGSNIIVLIAGSGNSAYLWSTGSISENLTVSLPGSYYVNVTNGYGCSTRSDTVIVSEIPLPVVSVSAPGNTAMCSGGTLEIFSSIDNYNPAYSYSYLWTGGTASANMFATVTGDYSVTVTNIDYSCSASSVPVHTNFILPYEDEEICIVTVDTITWKNKVMWEKTTDVGTAGFNIYKEVATNIYSGIGFVPYSDPSFLIDNSSQPEAFANRYKIAVIDTCGNESSKSFYHMTMNLTIAANGNTMGLNWSHYIDESGTFVPSLYYIYRGTSPSNMQILASVPGTVNSYNDVNIFDVYYYMVGVEKASGCNTAKTPTYSYSNKKDNSSLVGINSTSLLTGTILITPNPMTNTTTLTIPNFNNSNTSEPLQITDITGKVVLCISLSHMQIDSNKAHLVIERGNLKSGIYFVELNAEKKYWGKLIIE